MTELPSATDPKPIKDEAHPPQQPPSSRRLPELPAWRALRDVAAGRCHHRIVVRKVDGVARFEVLAQGDF